MTEEGAKQILRDYRVVTGGFIDLREAIDIAIQALEEIQSYRAIGTVEELQKIKDLGDCYIIPKNGVWEVNGVDIHKAFEKQIPKKITYQIGKNGLKHEKCPTCGSFHVFGNYCTECGQRLNWGNE